MIKNYFKIGWRNLLQKPAFTLLNTLGLSIGIAAALLLFLVVRYEQSFDTFHKDHKRIYRVVQQNIYANGSKEFTPGSALPVAVALGTDIPQFEKIVPVFGTLDPQVTVLGSDFKATNSAIKFIEKGEGLLVGPDFFSMFNFRWLLGNPSVLSQPNVVVLSKTLAEKYFQDYRQAFGKYLRINNQTTMRVVGVLADPPVTTDFPLNLVISYASKRTQPKLFGFGTFDNWNSTSSNDQIFVLLPEKLSATAANSLLRTFSGKHYYNRNDNVQKTHFLSPLSDMHHDARFAGFNNNVISRDRIQNIAVVGMLTLLMACINFINIYSALASRRAKEVGIRKVMGSRKRQLVSQFLTETFLIVFASLIFGVVLAYIGLPLLEKVFNAPADAPLYFAPEMALWLLGLLIALTLLSGFYPSLILSSFSPLDAFRKKLSKGSIRNASLRQILIVFQFSTAVVLMISMMVNLRQTEYLNRLDLGFEKEGVFTLNMDPEYRLRYQTFRNEVLQLPGIEAVSFSSDLPSSNNNWSSKFYFTDLSKQEDFEISMKMADGDYFATYGIRFLAGEAYKVTDTLTKFIVNETFLKKLGIKNPESVIGRRLQLGGSELAPIVGVVKDFHTSSAREETKPILVQSADQFYWSGGIKVRSQNLSQTMNQIKTVYEKVFPEVAFDGKFYNESIENYYKSERQMGLVYQVFAGLAFFIACLGLFGLAAFIAEVRTKEIGVRKTLGASIVSIVALLSKDFLKLVLIAILIASPLAWYLTNKWLQNFKYKVVVDWWLFGLAGGVAIVIALLTVSFQSIKAALMNPVKSLRSE